MAKNQTSKYSKEFINKTIKIWQAYSDVPLSSNDAIEITENMISLFNFLITVDIKNNQKEGDSD